MQSNIQYPPTVMPGCHVDSRLFREQHEWAFIIHAIESTRCMYAFYVYRFFMFVAVQHMLDFVKKVHLTPHLSCFLLSLANLLTAGA